MDEFEALLERFELSAGRIAEIARQADIPEPYERYFREEAAFLCEAVREIRPEEMSLEELKEHDRILFGDLKEENYETSYANPSYASQALSPYGAELCFLYVELKGISQSAAEYRFYCGRDQEAARQSLWDVTVRMELFLGIYSSFTPEELPSPAQIRGDLISFAEDYAPDLARSYVKARLDPGWDFALRIVMDSDLTDPRYLYRFGEPVTEDVIRISGYLGSLPEERIQAMASTYTKGFADGFAAAKKDLSRKKTVGIRYHLGFERMIRAAAEQFGQMGLDTLICRHACSAVNGAYSGGAGWGAAVGNPQYDYDHRQDAALFLTSDYAARRLRALQNAFEEEKGIAGGYAGPAVIITFGEEPFHPRIKPECLSFTPAQQKLVTKLKADGAQIQSRYIRPSERSYTIISYPTPQIGDRFEEIFDEVVKVNTLDSGKYRQIQQKLIDVLDTSEWVLVKGKGDNETDLIIHLHELRHPVRQTNFENCTADVNIPVGEVFTSPVLAGTGGILHVKGVYLEGLFFKDLRLVFDCGQVIDYSCANFRTEEENRKYIEDNLLFHHEKIPMGEFAIGTNTTAYRMAKKLGIEGRLPILIAEKMGPHFALGDTCYAREEEVRIYNPDGKEVIARENELSALRNEDPELAYYNCHTDITLPYDELDSISVVDEDGEETFLIANGRFVVPGTQELNEPLED